MCPNPCLLVSTGSKLQAPNIHKRIVRVCAHTLLKALNDVLLESSKFFVKSSLPILHIQVCTFGEP
jgi:hypothetical protein